MVGNGSVYVTAALSLNNSGLYTCMAFNHITGSSISASLQLTLKCKLFGLQIMYAVLILCQFSTSYIHLILQLEVCYYL